MPFKSITVLFLFLFSCTTTVFADVTVTTSSSGGFTNLEVIADNDDNDISISSYWNGRYRYLRIQGRNGTLINGTSVVYRFVPSGKLYIEAPQYNSSPYGETDVDIHDVSWLAGNIEISNVEVVTVQRVTIGRDLILGCPRDVTIFDLFARDIRSVHDYAATRISIKLSELSRNVDLYTRILDMDDVEVGDSVYLDGTYLSDDFVLTNVRGRSYYDRPTIKAWLASGNDGIKFQSCRANFVYVHGGNGSDTLYRISNLISSSQFRSIESFK